MVGRTERMLKGGALWMTIVKSCMDMWVHRWIDNVMNWNNKKKREISDNED